jgi:serine/threonine-protein kinase
MSVPEPGLEILPGLTLLRRLGRGGMGEAWLARDAERAEDVVAKVLPAGAPAERVALLRREARLVRKLQHPRVVPVYGFRSGERASAVTLRFMRGGDATRRRGATPLEVVRLGREVAEALAYLHGLGVVHRDVKPSNVLLDEEGRAHLADFGIAAVLEGGEEDGVVVRGGGSRASMSPQQRAGDPPAPADDLYALGALLYELLSGRPPFPREATDAEILARDPPPVASPFPVPGSLRALVAALLSRSPEGRPPSATAVMDALDAFGAQLDRSPIAPARPPVPLQPPPRVEEGGVSARGLEGRLERLRSRPRSGLSPGQVTLLAGLAAATVLAVVWLPRWAERAPSAGSPAPAPSAAATAVPSAAPAAVAVPAEATPDPPAEAPGAAAPASPPSAPRARVPVSAPPTPVPAVAPPTPSPLPSPDRQAEAQALARHRESGRALEEAEDWRGAVADYEAALAIDPFVAFAVEGRARAAARAALAEALAFHAANPQRLATEAVAREAEALLDRARDVEAPGPRHRAQAAALEKALGEARVPVAVVLESDGLTEIVLSRVGRMGTLTRRTVELRPGTYTAVGSRRGFRDVRRQFTVAPGGPAPVVSVRCEEAI